MIKVKKIEFKFDEEVARALSTITFEITELTKIDKEILKWQLLKEAEISFEERGRLLIKWEKIIKSKEINELIKEIEIYVKETKEKIKKVLKETNELKKFLKIIEEA